MRDWSVFDKVRTYLRKGKHVVIFSFIRNDEKMIMKIYFHLIGLIKVKLLYDALHTEWENVLTTLFLDHDDRGRRRKKKVEFPAIYYKTSLTPTSSSANLFYQKKMAIFYDVESFSDVFIYFCSNAVSRLNLPVYIDLNILIDVYKTWLEKEETKKLTTEKKFMKYCEGFLKLYVSAHLNGKKVHISVDEREFSIISGIYVSPYAEEIFKNNKNIIDGILMDTTWKLIPCYVTSILMLSICNVGIPVAFCFGDSENTELYDMFFKVFKENYYIDLSTFVIESDQGKALSAICSKYKCKHIGCLKHLITSLGLGPFSKQVSDLVSAKCDMDYETLRKMYSEKFSEYINTDSFKELEKTLGKVGMKYNVDTHEIMVEKPDKWEKFSQIKRIEYGMPSTTNALESSHCDDSRA